MSRVVKKSKPQAPVAPTRVAAPSVAAAAKGPSTAVAALDGIFGGMKSAKKAQSQKATAPVAVAGASSSTATVDAGASNGGLYRREDHEGRVALSDDAFFAADGPGGSKMSFGAPASSSGPASSSAPKKKGSSGSGELTEVERKILTKLKLTKKDKVVRAATTRSSEGLKMMTEEEILQATGAGGAKAGSTPNCPFDCDCCF
jgi:hypothetical protein